MKAQLFFIKFLPSCKVYKQSSKHGWRRSPRGLHRAEQPRQKNARRAFYEVATGQRDLDSAVSYMGHLQHINSDKFLKKVFDELGGDYQFPNKNKHSKN